MILTIDIGNSRIKWAAWQDAEIVARGASAYEKENSARIFDVLFAELTRVSKSTAIPQPVRVVVASVAKAQVAAALSDWVKQTWALDVEYLKTEKQFQNIINAYEHPQQHGVDRWAAVVAGHLSFSGCSVCVISAGTATTFDFINKNGQHLGGYILPSYATMHAALMTDTANVEAAFSMRFHQHGIPTNTNDAVNQGLHKLIQAGIGEFCQLAQSKMDAPMKIILTGGFAKTILQYPDMPEMIHKPDLLMQGIFTLMQQDKL